MLKKDSARKQHVNILRANQQEQSASVVKQRKLNSKGQMVRFASSDQNIIHYIDSNINGKSYKHRT